MAPVGALIPAPTLPNASVSARTPLSPIPTTQGGSTAVAPSSSSYEKNSSEAGPDTSSSRSLVPSILAGIATVAAPITAAAQTPALEQIVSTVPSLPPAWQMIVGGLLYVEPLGRAVVSSVKKIVSWFFKKEEPVGKKVTQDVAHDELETPPAKLQTITEKINEATGRYEQAIAPTRDLAALGLGLYTGAKILFSGEPIAAHLPEAIALGLSTWSYFDRTGRVEKEIVKNQIETGERLTPEGWRTQEARSLGVLAPNVPKNFPPEHKAGPTPPRYSEGAKPGFSLLRNLRAFRMTVGMLGGVMRRSHAYMEGVLDTFRSWFQSIQPGKHAAVSEKYLQAVDVLFPQWVMRMCEHYGVSLNGSNIIDRLKEIPKGAPVVLAAFPHSSIYPDFFIWNFLSRIRIVADKKNFHDHWTIRAIGLAWFLDVIALLYAVRNKVTSKSRPGNETDAKIAGATDESSLPSGATAAPYRSDFAMPTNGNTNLYEQAADRMSRYGIMPLIYPQEGRVPRAYRDDRTLGRPGFYSNIPKPKNPERYFNLKGTIQMAIAAAKKSEQDAYIPLLQIDGAGRIMPKKAKNPPFFQTVQPGEVTFSIGPIIRVSADSNVEEVSREIIAAAKETLKINEFLRKEVVRWEEQCELPTAAKAFAKAADANEIYYIIADRIRSVHPNRPERNEFKNRLLQIAIKPNDEDLKTLLTDVSTLVEETQYQ